MTAIKYLCQGLESKKKITLLLKLTSTKENIQGGIFDHLVNNLSISQSAMLNNLTPGNLSVAIKDLNAIAEVVEKINEFNVYDKSHTK